MGLTQLDMQVVVVVVQEALVKTQALPLQLILPVRGALESPLLLQGHLLATQVVAGVELPHNMQVDWELAVEEMAEAEEVMEVEHLYCQLMDIQILAAVVAEQVGHRPLKLARQAAAAL